MWFIAGKVCIREIHQNTTPTTPDAAIRLHNAQLFLDAFVHALAKLAGFPHPEYALPCFSVPPFSDCWYYQSHTSAAWVPSFFPTLTPHKSCLNHSPKHQSMNWPCRQPSTVHWIKHLFVINWWCAAHMLRWREGFHTCGIATSVTTLKYYVENFGSTVRRHIRHVLPWPWNLQAEAKRNELGAK